MMAGKVPEKWLDINNEYCQDGKYIVMFVLAAEKKSFNCG